VGEIDCSSEYFDALGEPRGVVGDAFLGDHLALLVDDCDVVVGFGQSTPQNSFTSPVPR
jgi:hypothetical protein